MASDTPEHLERALSNQQTIEILAKGSQEDVNNIAKEIAGVESVELSEGKEEGTTSARIVAASGEDIREKVFCAFANAGCPLLQMMSSKTSLEDVFLELTQNNAEEAKETVEEVAQDAGDL